MNFDLNLPGTAANNAGFDMKLPSNEELKKEIQIAVAPEDKELIELQKSANSYVENMMNSSTDNSVQRHEMVKAFDGFGMDLMKQSESKNKMLDFQINSLYTKSDEGGPVAKSLLDLQKEVKGLDPSGVDFAKKGLFGKIFNPIKDYFKKYQKAGAVIEGLVDELQKGGDILKRDNVALDQEMESMRQLTKNINKSILMGQMIDDKLTLEIQNAQNKSENPEKIKFFQEELVFPLKQRIIDLQTILTVNQQGFLAMDILKKNNRELIRGVERAKVVTINALKIAVIVAKALTDQEIVLKKIQALNTTTNNLLAGTAERLKTQGVEIQKQASESMLDAETLKKAFSDCMEAMESVSKYRQEALPRMSQTILEFKDLAEKGEQAIQRIEEGNQVELARVK